MRRGLRVMTSQQLIVSTGGRRVPEPYHVQMRDEFDDPDYDLGEEHFEPETKKTAERIAEEQEAASWEARGKELAKLHAEALSLLRTREWLTKDREKLTKCQWQIGDWLIEGERHHPVGRQGEVVSGYYIPEPPDLYSIAEEITSLTRYTLKDVASTARRCPPSVRTDACSWTHHRAIANALPKADHDEWKQWLQRAADEKMSVAKLQKAIKHPRGAPVKEKSFRVTVPLNVWETLKDFADNEKSTVQKIAQRWLVNQAGLADTESERIIAKKDVEARRKARRQEVGRKVATHYDPLGLQRD